MRRRVCDSIQGLPATALFFIVLGEKSYAVMRENNQGNQMKKRELIYEKVGRAGICFLMGLMLVMTGYLSAREVAGLVMGRNVKEIRRVCVVIDAGHGGVDPGKVGIDGSLEKDINLEIARKLKAMLETDGIEVVMTREGDGGLYEEKTSNKKAQDMARRVELIEKVRPVLVVSIHQNSYPEEYVKGAQVFYYSKSDESKKLAEIIQKSLRERIDAENKREAKPNGEYYLLKKTPVPTVIVECGFLTNVKEATLLAQEDYQERIAWSIHMGIMQALRLALGDEGA